MNSGILLVAGEHPKSGGRLPRTPSSGKHLLPIVRHDRKGTARSEWGHSAGRDEAGRRRMATTPLERGTVDDLDPDDLPVRQA